MSKWLDSAWLNVIVAIAGGITFGYGVGSLARGVNVYGALGAVLGVVLLWWALIDRRKMRRKNPESEADGSHTLE